MDILFKLDFIEGKNLGCIALKSIKIGTIIVQEKPVCYDKMKSKADQVKNLGRIWNSYQNMSQSDKLEYNKLYNRFKNEKGFFKEWRDQGYRNRYNLMDCGHKKITFMHFVKRFLIKRQISVQIPNSW